MGGLFVLAAILTVPLFLLLLATLALIGQLSFLAISAIGGAKDAAPVMAGVSGTPSDVFLSVHVPACREPPEVLIDTLACLKLQGDAVAHEVIVIISNTPNPALWQPVAEWCAEKGAPFRFLRCDGVMGAKAGALNIAMAESDPRTTHIVTVDADYQVDPTFLRDVGAEIAAGNSAFYQYPQAYRDVTPASAGIARELEDYFKRQALAANLGQAMLLTGTLSVVQKSALQAVGGWPTSSCTEDAALGTLLIGAGYHGVYVDRVVGHGLMPLDVAGLHKQRHRWASGNARVLVQWLTTGPFRSGRAAAFRNLLIVSQLAAWLNFGAVAGLTLLAGLVHLGRADGGAGLAGAAVWVSAAALMATVASAVPLLTNGALRRDGLQVRITAFWSRIAMLPVAAWATVVGFLPVAQRFQVTPKVLHLGRAKAGTAPVLVCAVLGTGVLAAALVSLHPGAMAAGLVLLLPLIGMVASERALQAQAVTGPVR